MALDKMVPNVLLGFPTLVILNSIGIVSSQDELEHGLATNCQSKGMKTVTVSKVFQVYDKDCCFLGTICGDKCLENSEQICECGNTTFDMLDRYYCCISRNETCKSQGI